jgi:hypothetical protein
MQTDARNARQILFLDFDGCLHRGAAHRTSRGIVSGRPEVELFEYTEILVDAIRPYSQLEIVLSSSWVEALGFRRARDSLPLPELRKKVTGATYHSKYYDADVWNQISRGQQVMRYVNRHHLTRWLAIDDRDDGFGDAISHLVRCDENRGLGDVVVQQALKQALKKMFGPGHS